jgi:hypothetical protein
MWTRSCATSLKCWDSEPQMQSLIRRLWQNAVEPRRLITRLIVLTPGAVTAINRRPCIGERSRST